MNRQDAKAAKKGIFEPPRRQEKLLKCKTLILDERASVDVILAQARIHIETAVLDSDYAGMIN